ncbi:ComEC/Rec2 family competence protein [Brucepastera parasyntrophica]|uniref:ComEC/Rec2 family competence protein n=1 Tax=Brucepastera parasyntrophica TaxID=2880008 RepID=UPI0021096A14|nr:ComEC/Rec2 family competence protein [Brucepastera parasyntrophica]ULQ60065.1 ComEC/Rec2 family competence protein [Brucepastera parasyntrophica]
MRVRLIHILYDWGDAGGLLLALLSANRDYLSPGLAGLFRNAGLAHVLALSGMHLSLFGLVAITIGRKIGGRRFSVKLSLLALCIFVWFAGPSSSLNRALYMAIGMLLLKQLGFVPKVLPVMAASCVFQLIVQPNDALTLSFLLSYSALLGILTVGEALGFLTKKWLPDTVFSGISASVGAQCVSTPFIAATIKILAPVGIISSCVVSPLISIFLIAGMFLVFLTILFPFSAFFCGKILSFLYRLIVIPVRFFSGFPLIILEDLPAIITAVILSITVSCSLCCFAAKNRCRRSVDVCFTEL